MAKRTEEEKVVKASITVILGGQQYEVAPLVIRDSRGWRAKVATVLRDVPQYLGVTSDTPDAFTNALDMMINKNPDTIIDLFFDYAKDLDRDEIEGKADEAELAVAWGQIVEVAFPLVGSLVKVIGRLSP